ncbi:Riboflavin synthase-like beta-barrel [Phytophthora cactorum]|nr:Riboflavin synthase-like beta-barrel [Phytophthora cactorum]
MSLPDSHEGDTLAHADPYVNAVSPRYHRESEKLTWTQKCTRLWTVTRWRLSRTIFSVPIPILTARFDMKLGDLIITLPLLENVWRAATLAMIFVFVLAVRNNSLLLALTGIPFERALFYHKLFSYATIVLTVVHACAYYVAPGEHVQTEDKDMDYKLLTGYVSFVAMVFLCILSVNKIRRRFFELFLRSHWILFIVATVFASLHGAPYIIVGVLPWFFDMLNRLVFRAHITLIQFPRVRKDTGEAFEYEAGQYAFVCIPSISYLEWHPFTFSSSPNETMVTMHIKTLGDWTKKVTIAAVDTTEYSPFDILLDGPYGKLSVDIDTPGVYSHYVLLSGGIGMTPMRSIVNWLYTEHHEGYRPDIKNVHFVWSVRDRDLIQALVDGTGLHHETSNHKSYFPARIQDANEPTSTFFSEFYLTRGEKDVEALLDHQLTSCLRYGSRPDTAKILRAMGEKAKEAGSTRVAVLACGPNSLVSDVVVASITLSKEMNIHFDVHTELFDF